jgi:predicted metal-dependent phosphoesterase TrpH
MNFDFHIHSTYSDGSSSLEEIFKTAKEKNVQAISITDHDTILGLSKVDELSKKFSIPFIPGVEFTAVEKGIKFHVLAYNIDAASLELINYSKELLNFLNSKSLKQIDILKKNGISIDAEEYFKQSKGGPLYRAKLLRTLSAKGYIREEKIMNMLGIFFSKNGICYIEEDYDYYDFESICKLIKRNDGLVVLAHPSKIKKKNEYLYKELINSELLDGIEVYHPSVNEEVKAELKNIIKRKDLLTTGGSDYHGIFNKKYTPICGMNIPQYVYDNLYYYLKNKIK